jgi:hypothetical protein
MVKMGLSHQEVLGDQNHGVRGLFIQDFIPRDMSLRVRCFDKASNRVKSRLIPLDLDCKMAVQCWLDTLGLSFHDRGRMFDIGYGRLNQVLRGLSREPGIRKTTRVGNLRLTAIASMLWDGISEEEVRRRVVMTADLKLPFARLCSAASAFRTARTSVSEDKR